MPLLHTMLSATAHKQAEGQEGCHRNVYKSRPEECKQSWEELLSDKRVNFRQSCCDLPVWSFNNNTARILSEWMIVWAFLSFYSPSKSNKTCILVYRKSSGEENACGGSGESHWFTQVPSRVLNMQCLIPKAPTNPLTDHCCSWRGGWRSGSCSCRELFGGVLR